MFVAEKIIANQRIVDQALQYHIHETRLTKI